MVAIVARCRVQAEEVLLEISMVVAKESAGGDEIVREPGVVGGLVVMAIVIFVVWVLGGLSVAGGEGEKGLVKLLLPGELDALGDESFVSQYLRGGEVGVDEIPAMKVTIILEAEAVQKTSSTDFEATGKVLEFDKRFFQLGVDSMVRSGEQAAVDEGCKPIIDPEVETEIETLEGEVCVWIVSVTSGIFKGRGRGVADESVKVKSGRW